MNEEHQRVLQFVLDGLECVGGEILGEFARRHGAGGEAGEELPRDEDQQGGEESGIRLCLVQASRAQRLAPGRAGARLHKAEPYATKQNRHQEYRLVRHHRGGGHGESGKQHAAG